MKRIKKHVQSMILTLATVFVSSFMLSLLSSTPVWAMAKVACDDRTQIYKICTDQTELFQQKAQEAIKQNRLLLINFGADWCPWSKSVHKILSDSENWKSLDTHFLLLEIGVFGPDSKTKIESGRKILSDLLKANKVEIAKFRTIPLLVIVNPKTNQAEFLRTGAFEDNSKGKQGHSQQKLLAAILEAMKDLKNKEMKSQP